MIPESREYSTRGSKPPFYHLNTYLMVKKSKQARKSREGACFSKTAPRKKQEDHNTYNILKAILLRIKGSVISSIMMGSSADC